MSTGFMLLDEARELGFVAAGVAAAAPASRHEVYAAWLRAGNHGGMRYLERHAALRADPRRWQPSVRSILVTAMRYPLNLTPEAGGFAALARGRDYHAVVLERLEELGRRLHRQTGAAVLRTACDAAPLAEREWAVRAGLGWIGKQGQLVNPEHGCCLVMGALLTDLVMEAGHPQENRCGDCRLCLDACPTGALDGKGRLDARRCLAYLTVEHAGPLPPLASRAGCNTLFGCDRCTAVCPWNRNACLDDVPVSLRGRPQDLPDAAACRTMTEEEFQVRFAGTVVQRSGVERLRRNAACPAVKKRA